MLLWVRVLCSPANLHLQGLAGSPHALWLWAGQHHRVDGAGQRGGQPQSACRDLTHLLPQSSGLQSAENRTPQERRVVSPADARLQRRWMPQQGNSAAFAAEQEPAGRRQGRPLEGHRQSGIRGKCMTRAICLGCSSQLCQTAVACRAHSKPRPLSGGCTSLAGAGHCQCCGQAMEARPSRLQQAVGQQVPPVLAATCTLNTTLCRSRQGGQHACRDGTGLCC